MYTLLDISFGACGRVKVMLDPMGFRPVHDHVVVAARVYDIHVDDRMVLVFVPLPDDWADME